MKEERDQLIGHLGRLVAVRRQIADARRQIRERASEQAASIPDVQDHVEAHLARDQGGGPLGHRALRKLITERARLHQLLMTDPHGGLDDAG